MIKTQTTDMTQGNPVKLIVTFALPMLIGSIFQLMYNMVDSIVVGKFVGADALASIGATGSTTFLLLALATGMTVGDLYSNHLRFIYCTNCLQHCSFYPAGVR